MGVDVLGAEPVIRYVMSPLTDLVFRDAQATGDGSWLVEGYAAVFNQETVLYDGRFYVARESIAPGAFRDVLSRAHDSVPLLDRTVVHLNNTHDMKTAVAATDAPGPVGRLLLEEDAHGLRFTARIDRQDPDAVSLASKLRLGIVKQASFAFTIGEQETVTRELPDGREEDTTRILQVKGLYDVCVCPQGAYPQTVSMLRSYAAAIGRPDDSDGGHPRRVTDVAGVSTVDGGRGEQVDDLRLRQLKARGKSVTARHTRSGI